PVEPGPGAHGARDLREDVVGVAVARVLQVAVARGVDALEALARVVEARDARDFDEDRPTFDADPLRRHADPDVTRTHDLFLGADPVGVGVDATAHVEPFDHDVAAELRRIGRRAHQHAGAVRRAPLRLQLPLTVARQRADDLVRRRGALRLVLA